jgi:hypothetical protein
MILVTTTADEIVIELSAVYGGNLAFSDYWALWKADNPDYADITAFDWYVTNGAIGDTYADLAFEYWHSLATGMQLIAEDGHHVKTEENKFIITES